MNNDNDLNLHSLTKLSGWLRYCFRVSDLGFYVNNIKKSCLPAWFAPSEKIFALAGNDIFKVVLALMTSVRHDYDQDTFLPTSYHDLLDKIVIFN